jgi:hypothetical protein
MPQIVAVRTKNDSSQDTIAVVLSQDAICLGPDGQPWSGVSLNAKLARSLAARLLDLAKEVEGQGPLQTQDSRPSLADVSSVLVLHDGSAQGHRAFSLALDVASRSLATICLVGLCGIRQDRFEPSDAVEDYHWQRGWMERLAQMYAREAEHGGVDLRTILVAASDQKRLCEMLNEDGYDLVVIPRRFADEGAALDAFSTFNQSLTGAVGSTILFCP